MNMDEKIINQENNTVNNTVNDDLMKLIDTFYNAEIKNDEGAVYAIDNTKSVSMEIGAALIDVANRLLFKLQDEYIKKNSKTHILLQERIVNTIIAMQENNQEKLREYSDVFDIAMLYTFINVWKDTMIKNNYYHLLSKEEYYDEVMKLLQSINNKKE